MGGPGKGKAGGRGTPAKANAGRGRGGRGGGGGGGAGAVLQFPGPAVDLTAVQVGWEGDGAAGDLATAAKALSAPYVPPGAFPMPAVPKLNATAKPAGIVPVAKNAAVPVVPAKATAGTAAGPPDLTRPLAVQPAVERLGVAHGVATPKVAATARGQGIGARSEMARDEDQFLVVPNSLAQERFVVHDAAVGDIPVSELSKIKKVAEHSVCRFPSDAPYLSAATTVTISSLAESFGGQINAADFRYPETFDAGGVIDQSTGQRVQEIVDSVPTSWTRVSSIVMANQHANGGNGIALRTWKLPRSAEGSAKFGIAFVPVKVAVSVPATVWPPTAGLTIGPAVAAGNKLTVAEIDGISAAFGLDALMQLRDRLASQYAKANSLTIGGHIVSRASSTPENDWLDAILALWVKVEGMAVKTYVYHDGTSTFIVSDKASLRPSMTLVSQFLELNQRFPGVPVASNDALTDGHALSAVMHYIGVNMIGLSCGPTVEVLVVEDCYLYEPVASWQESMTYVDRMSDFVMGLATGWMANEASVVHGVGGVTGMVSNQLLSAFKALGVPDWALDEDGRRAAAGAAHCLFHHLAIPMLYAAHNGTDRTAVAASLVPLSFNMSTILSTHGTTRTDKISAENQDVVQALKGAEVGVAKGHTLGNNPLSDLVPLVKALEQYGVIICGHASRWHAGIAPGWCLNADARHVDSTVVSRFRDKKRAAASSISAYLTYNHMTKHDSKLMTEVAKNAKGNDANVTAQCEIWATEKPDKESAARVYQVRRLLTAARTGGQEAMTVLLANMPREESAAIMAEVAGNIAVVKTGGTMAWDKTPVHLRSLAVAGVAASAEDISG